MPLSSCRLIQRPTLPPPSSLSERPILIRGQERAENQRFLIEPQGFVPIKGTTREVILGGPGALVPLNFWGLAFLSLDNPGHPKLLKVEDSLCSPVSFFVRGRVGYEAERGFRLQVWDFSDPTSPVLRFQEALPAFPISLVENRGRLFVACGGDGAVIYDVSEPFLPKRLSNFNDVEFTRRLAVDEDRLYLADGNYGGLKIVDVSNPTSPTLLSRLLTADYADDVLVRGNLVYVADRQGGARIVDVSDPRNPFTPCIIWMPKNEVRDLQFFGRHYLLVADRNQGLRVYDIRDPERPLLVADYSLRGPISKITVREPYVYVALWDQGVQVLRLTPPP
ncbi:MAG: hypothetical protein V2A74_07595 [bacterium]